MRHHGFGARVDGTVGGSSGGHSGSVRLMVKQPRSSKRQIEANRREKAERKRLRKVERAAGEADGDAGDGSSPMDHDAVIAALAALHQSYDDGEIGLDELESGRLELTSRLHVD